MVDEYHYRRREKVEAGKEGSGGEPGPRRARVVFGGGIWLPQ